MITPSFSLTATERVLPRLALDFTTASLDSRVTIARSGNTATAVNSSGFIAIVNANLPRFDFSPVTLACNGLLIEESRTNSILYSNDLSQSSTWSVSTATLTPNAVVSPDGTQNAATISAAAQNPLAAQFFTIAADASTYCISLFVKYVSGSKNFRLRCALTNGVAVATNIAFNAETGAFVSSSAGAVYTITNAGNGWFRVSLLATNNLTNNRLNFQIYSGNDATVTNSMAVYGAQSEVGAFVTSYIPTAASQVTRTADVATMTGTNFSDWFNQSQGSFMTRFAGNAGWAFQMGEGSNFNNRIACSPISTNNLVVSNSVGTNQCAIGTYTGTVGTFVNIAGAYQENNFATSSNAGAISSDTSGTLASPSAINFGSRNSATPSGFINSWIQKFYFWPQRLTDAELQAFSK